MLRLKELLETRKKLLGDLEAAAEADDSTKFDELEKRMQALDEEIDRLEKRTEKIVAMRATGAEAEERAQEPTTPSLQAVQDTGRADVVRSTDRRFDSMGDHMVAVRAAGTAGMRTPEMLIQLQGDMREQRAASGLSAAVPSDGGFFLQAEHDKTLIKKTFEGGKILSCVSDRTLGYEFDSITVNGIDETSRADGSRHGGVRGYWADEAEALTASKPKFDKIELKPSRIGVAYYATQKLLRAASFLEGEIEELVAKEFTFKYEDAIMHGSGAGQPLGISKGKGILEVAIEPGQLIADPVLAENISKMYARCPVDLRGSAAWFINQELEPYLDKLNFAVGAGGQLVYVGPGGIADAPHGRLKGLPIVPCEMSEAPGTVGDIMLVAFGSYRFVRRPSLLGASSIHVKFLESETVFKFETEVDGQPTWKKALMPYKGTKTVSPVVALAART